MLDSWNVTKTEEMSGLSDKLDLTLLNQGFIWYDLVIEREVYCMTTLSLGLRSLSRCT